VLHDMSLIPRCTALFDNGTISAFLFFAVLSHNMHMNYVFYAWTIKLSQIKWVFAAFATRLVTRYDALGAFSLLLVIVEIQLVISLFDSVVFRLNKSIGFIITN
jgi:hypothetical protein